MAWCTWLLRPAPRTIWSIPSKRWTWAPSGTRRMLELAREKRARYLLTSTSECYGDPLVHPQVETYWGNVNPVGPRSCYDESKRFAEALTMAYHRKHGVRTNIARIFNTYGPRMKLDDGRVVPAFLDQALRGAAPHGFRRRLANAQLLLRERHGGGAVPADALRGALPGEPGESERDDDSGIRRTHPPHDRKPAGDRVPAAARGRPQAAPPRYRARRARCSGGSRACRWRRGCASRWSISAGCKPPLWCKAQFPLHWWMAPGWRNRQTQRT